MSNKDDDISEEARQAAYKCHMLMDECMERSRTLLQDYLDGKITMRQFLDGRDEIRIQAAMIDQKMADVHELLFGGGSAPGAN